MPNPKHFQYPVAPLPLEVYRAQNTIIEAIYNLSSEETLKLAAALKYATVNVLKKVLAPDAVQERRI